MHSKLARWYTPTQGRPLRMDGKPEYREHPPSPILRPYIACYWSISAATEEEGSGRVETRVLPDGCVDFIFTIERTSRCSGILFVSTDLPFIARPDPRAITLGVRFRPGGAYAFVREPMSQFQKDPAPLEALLDGIEEIQQWLVEVPGVTEKVQALDSQLVLRLNEDTRMPNDTTISNLLYRIYRTRGNVSIEELARREVLSARHLHRLFNRWIGLGPKQFCRIVRFQHALQMMLASPSIDGADLAAACGYADQAHLIREFKTLAGSTPNRILKC